VSVYVADELWDKVKALAPETGGSQLIQETIREYVDRRERKPYAVLTDDLLARKKEAARKAVEKLAAPYHVGYAVGLRLADDLTWELFRTFADADWDLDEFDSVTVNEGTGRFEDYQFPDAWAGVADEYHLNEDVYPDGPVLEGIVDALKDLWEVVSNAQGPRRPDPLVPAPGARGVTPTSEPETDAEAVIVPFRGEAESAEPI
jgi:hypothetical protein